MTHAGATLAPAAGDALIIVDVQNDFLPGGSLAVPRGEEVIPPLNLYLALFQSHGLPVFATRDWHPEDHCSFKPQGGPWPPHCIAGTRGAEFAAELELSAQIPVISKGTLRWKDAYSGFEGTDLARRLKQLSVGRVYVGGLATDYCVLNTVKDARAAGLRVILLRDACRAVNVQPPDGTEAEHEMERLGAIPAEYGAVAAD